MEAEFDCAVCRRVVVNPVVTACQHLFCRECLLSSLELNARCPTCGSRATEETAPELQTAMPMMWRMLLRMPNVACRSPGCDFVGVDYLAMTDHMQTQCAHATVHCPHRDIGCQFTGPPAALHDHTTQCAFRAHLPLLQRLNNFQLENRVLRFENFELRHRLDALERRVMDGHVWTPVADMHMPGRGKDAAVVECGGLLYVLGGVGPRGNCLDHVERFDPQANAWQVVAPMNVARKRHTAVECGGCIFVLGGCEGTNLEEDDEFTSSVERYDPETRGWSLVASMSTPRDQPAAVSCDGYIYVRSSHGWERYDPQLNAWNFISHVLPGPADFHPSQVVAIGSSIFLLFGELRQCFRYETTTNTWLWEVPFTFVPAASHFSCMAYRERILLICGYQVEAYNAPDGVHVQPLPMQCYNINSRYWSAVSAPWVCTQNVFKTAVCAGYLYVFTPSDGKVARWPLPFV